MAKGNDTPTAPTFGAVAPPKRRGRSGAVIDEATADALMGAMEDARTEEGNDGWIGDGRTYDTSGKAQSAARRYRRALLDHGFITDVKEVQTRVWSDDGNDAANHFALRVKETTAE